MYPLTQFEHGTDDVLILATDGLWDVLSNEDVAEAVTCFLGNCDPDDQNRQVFLHHSETRMILPLQTLSFGLFVILKEESLTVNLVKTRNPRNLPFTQDYGFKLCGDFVNFQCVS